MLGQPHKAKFRRSLYTAFPAKGTEEWRLPVGWMQIGVPQVYVDDVNDV